MQSEPQITTNPKRPRVRRTCPRCGGSETVYSRRRWVGERALGVLHVRPFRCLDCDHRFMRIA